MKSVLVAAAMTLCLACGTKRNEERCLEGLCSDPDLPFCDVDGTISGTPNACVAVDCTPGEFASCRGDRALTCNTTGDNYDLVQCANGCDANGCKPCTTPECEKHIIPRYLPTICDQLLPGDPVTITQNTMIDTTNAQSCSSVVPQIDGPEICVLRFSALTIDTNRSLSFVGSRAIAIVADRDLKVDGFLDVSANGRTNGPGSGGVMSGSCSGTAGGGGGAGYRTMGGSGGGSGGSSGGLVGALPTAVVDLRGGTRPTANGCSPGGAGGAAMLVSCRGTVAVSGMIDAGGGGGLGNHISTPPTMEPPGGGGSGGTVVLQGMMINATGQFYANGGGGGGQNFSCNPGCTYGGAGADGPQTTGTAPGGLGAGVGGRGGSGTSAPTSGLESGAGAEAGGGGGGSAGFFLSYTPSAVQPAIAPVAASPGFLPNGTIATN